MPRQTTNPSTKETFNRFRARVKLGDNKYAMLGNYEDTAEDAVDYYTFDEQFYTNTEANDDEDSSALYCKKNVIRIETLAELMFKICNVTWNESMQRQIFMSSEAGLNPDSPVYKWMKSLLDGDDEDNNSGMVDVFRHFYPDAEAR